MDSEREKAHLPAKVDTLRPYSLKAKRAEIRDCYGRTLARSRTVYDIHFDPTVNCDFQDWIGDVRILSEGLAAIFPEKTADEYDELFINARNSGGKYLLICKNVDSLTFGRLQQIPLFTKSSAEGGIIVEPGEIREYPYGKLARRTIGFVRNGCAESNGHVGIEGKYDYLLKGEDGYILMKSKWVRWPLRPATYKHKVKKTVEPKNGEYVDISIDMDIQAKADSLLRETVGNDENVGGACLVISQVDNGAVRAMVNLTRDFGDIGEYYNVAIARCYEPGLLLAPATALAAMKCGTISSLSDKIPTNHGRSDFSKMADRKILEYERENGVDSISVKEGMLMSSSYVMAALAEKSFYGEEQTFVDSLKQVIAGEGYQSLFWEIDGLGKLTVQSPDEPEWSISSLGSIGCGYSVSAPSLYYLSLYNAIARGGTGIYHRMVGNIIRNKKFLNKDIIWCPLEYEICTKSQADEMTDALVECAARYKDIHEAKRTIAGNTGSSFAVQPNGRYVTDDGKKTYQTTFAGFFPAEKPEYSIICMVYTKPSMNFESVHSIPSKVVAGLVNSMY